jgi:hypothetical protein
MQCLGVFKNKQGGCNNIALRARPSPRRTFKMQPRIDWL